MNKKFFLLVAVMLGTALCQVLAQKPFEVKTPPFRKYVKVIGSGVNLRQSPSAQSPRLVVQSEENELGDVMEELVWINRPLKKNEEAARASVLPVWETDFMSSVKVADGWLCGDYEGTLVYVMEKFCKPVSLRPLSEKEEKRSIDNLTVIKSGKYRNYCIAECENMIGEHYLSLGKYVDGMFIFNYDIFYSQSESRESLFKDGVIFIGSKLTDQFGFANLQKLIQDQATLDLLMKKGVNINNYNPVFYYGVEGDDEWYCIGNIY